MPSSATVQAVSADSTHRMSKPGRDEITVLAGLGVAGDAHLGERVQHRSRVARDPDQPNLRQVHLIHADLLQELRAAGFEVVPGMLGENITTLGVDLLGLATGSLLGFTGGAVLEVTGLRNPCLQLDGLQPGLMKAVLDRDESGRLIRKAGVMAIVLAGGPIAAGAAITVTPPEGEPIPLEPV